LRDRAGLFSQRSTSSDSHPSQRTIADAENRDLRIGQPTVFAFEFCGADAAMNLGDAGRKAIKGHHRGYYLNILQEARAKSLAEFRMRDDAWLMAVDKDWLWGRANNYCKCFHVCGHEPHHTGQIAFLKKRLPNLSIRGVRFRSFASCYLSPRTQDCSGMLRILRLSYYCRC
jgi:hypothetical protein